MLEVRQLLAFSVVGADLFAAEGGLRLVVNFNHVVNAATVQTSDLTVDAGQPATSVDFVDADTVAFMFPTLAAGPHTAALAAGVVSDTSGAGLDIFAKSFTVASDPQFTVNQNPRLQLGNAPLVGYTGSNLDQVDLLWQTKPGGAGTQDSFTVDYQAAGSTAWQSATLDTPIDTGVEGRVVRSATITGLNWNSDYVYRVRHLQADVIVDQYQSTFHSRLQAGDTTSFTFAAYGDSADGSDSPGNFRMVQGRINQVNPAFAVLLGDNAYDSATQLQLDSRLSPVGDPEAATWIASHIDYLGFGNHDIYTADGMPIEQNYSVPIPVAGVNAPAALPATERPEHNYSFDYGDVHFVTFDSNSRDTPAELDGQLNWCVADLEASTARWKIVYAHHPVAGMADVQGDPGDNYYQQVVSRLQAAGADLFMNGHSHTFYWTHPLTGQINNVATYVPGPYNRLIAGEGLPTLIAGVGGEDLQGFNVSGFPFVAKAFNANTSPPSRYGFAQITVTYNQILVRYIAADDGSVMDSFTLTKDANPQTAVFQQGLASYAGTVDTGLSEHTPDANNATATEIRIDSDDPNGSGHAAEALLRFDNLFGSSVGQIPTGAILRSGTLQLQITHANDYFNLYRMLGDWADSDTWNSLADGIQTDGVEAAANPDASTSPPRLGTLSVNVLASIQAWQSNPASNHGWALMPTGPSGDLFDTSEGLTPPKLIVTYVLPGETNHSPFAQDDSAAIVQDTVASVPVLTNDSDADGDTLSVQSVSQGAYGAVAINGSSVNYTPAAGFFGSDSFTYTAGDGHGGSATATVRVTVAPGTPQTVTFKQGVAGYTGTVDTTLRQSVPDTSYGSDTILRIDGDDPGDSGYLTEVLLRFDNLFGSGPGQIPTDAVLQSATLNFQVSDEGHSIKVNRMLVNWSGTDTWNSLGAGIQANGVEAELTPEVTTPFLAAGTDSIDVLASLRAWQAAPTSNHGWALLPTSWNGVEFSSAEGASPPQLIVSYVPRLTWSAAADGNWTDAQWSPSPSPAYPNPSVYAAVETPHVVHVTSAQAAASLSIGGGGAVSVGSAASLSITTDTNVAGGTLLVNPAGTFSTGGTLTIGAGATVTGGITVHGLSIANNGGPLGSRIYSSTLDIGSSGLVIDYGNGASPIAQIEDMVRSGYAGGLWAGHGITSSYAASHAGMNIAVLDNASLVSKFGTANGGPLFMGRDVSLHSILVRMTYMDDLVGQGIVSQDDAILFGASYDNGATSGRHWWQGDLTHDGVVNQDDAILFGSAYNPALPPLDNSGGQVVALAVTSSSVAATQPSPSIATAVSTTVGSSRVDLQACKLEYSIVSPK